VVVRLGQKRNGGNLENGVSREEFVQSATTFSEETWRRSFMELTKDPEMPRI
jgi:hypothetical protein